MDLTFLAFFTVTISAQVPYFCRDDSAGPKGSVSKKPPQKLEFFFLGVQKKWSRRVLDIYTRISDSETQENVECEVYVDVKSSIFFFESLTGSEFQGFQNKIILFQSVFFFRGYDVSFQGSKLNRSCRWQP